MPVAAAIPYITAAVAVAGAGVSAYGMYQQGQQQQQMAEYNAAVQRNNAQVNLMITQRQVQNQQALYDYQKTTNQQAQAQNMRAAQEQIARESQQKAALEAHQRAAYAGAGVVMEGTPLAILSDTEKKSQVMQADTLYQAEMKNYSLQNEFNVADYQKGLLNLDIYGAEQGVNIANSNANMTEMGGKSAAAGGLYGAGGTLLSGFSSGIQQGYSSYKAG